MDQMLRFVAGSLMDTGQHFKSGGSKVVVLVRAAIIKDELDEPY